MTMNEITSKPNTTEQMIAVLTNEVWDRPVAVVALYNSLDLAKKAAEDMYNRGQIVPAAMRWREDSGGVHTLLYYGVSRSMDEDWWFSGYVIRTYPIINSYKEA